jgi:hypothetical protein
MRHAKIALHLVLCAALVFGAAAPAYADFWDDLGRAAAAVATGGLSEVVRGLIDQINGMISRVRNLINTIQNDIRSAAQAAHDGGVAAANDTRDALNRVLNELEQARAKAKQELDAEKHKVDVIAKGVRTGVGAAAQAGGAAATSAARAGGAAAGAAATTAGKAAGAAATSAGKTAGSAAAGAGQAAGAGKAAGAAATAAGKAASAPAAGSEIGTLLKLQVGDGAAAVPADPKDILDALSEAERKLGEVQQGVQRDVAPFVQRSVQNALDQLGRQIGTVGDIVRDLLVAPFNNLIGMLEDLVHHPERIFNPISIVNDQIDRVTAAVDSAVERLVNDLTGDVTRMIHEVDPHMHRANDQSSKAAQIALAAQQLRQQRTRAQLERLRTLLGSLPSEHAKPVALVQLTPGFKAAALSGAVAKVDAGKTRAFGVSQRITRDLKAQWTEVQKLHAQAQTSQRARADVAVFQRVNTEFDTHFAGKSPQEIDAKRRELVAEAARRFAGNAQVREAAVRLINERAAGRPVFLVPAVRPVEQRAPTTPTR